MLCFLIACSLIADPSDLVGTQRDGGVDAVDVDILDVHSDDRADTASSEWQRDTASYRIALSLDNSRQNDTDLIGFPILVTLTAGNFDYRHAAPDGSDLTFVDPIDSSELPYELDTWTQGGTSQVWVRVPMIPKGSTDRFIELYFGDETAVDRQDSAAVFSDNYVGVLHMNEPSRDSSPEANATIADGASTEPGPVGGARLFKTGFGEITMNTSGYPLGLEPRTLCAFARLDEATEHWPTGLVTYGSTPTTHAYGILQVEGDLRCGYGDFGVEAEGIFQSGDYRYVCCAYDGTTQRAYVDGVPAASPLERSINLTEGIATIGGGARYREWKGAVDEVRVSNVARSEDWIAAEYRNLVGEFVGIGAEQTRPGE